MSKKKKKKISGEQKQKLAAAQYKKEFFRKFRSLFNVFCNAEQYPQIPPRLLELMYKIRSRYLTLIPTEGKYITHAVLEKFKSDFIMFHKEEKFKLGNDNIEVNLYDFLTVAFSLSFFAHLIKDDDFQGAKQTREAIEKSEIDKVYDEKVRMRMVSTFRAVALWHSDIEKCQYWFFYKPEFDNAKMAYCHKVQVHSLLPQIKSIVVDNIARPAIYFQWANPQVGPEDLFIKPSSLNIKGTFADIPMEIYIQKHALQRFSERIDCINTGYAQYFMYLSFKEPKVAYDSNNNLLIEYRYADKKAGYFRVDIVEGVLLVRTFLFITNNGTPEGQLLQKNTGLQKPDKKYLSMDKLSTFMSSDIGENTELRKILEQSGCQCLVELYELINDCIQKEGKSISDSLLIAYLKKETCFEDVVS